MPVWQRGDKWTFGQNKADYDSEEEAKRAYLAYLAKKHDVFNDDEDSDKERKKKLRAEIGRVLMERKRRG